MYGSLWRSNILPLHNLGWWHLWWLQHSIAAVPLFLIPPHNITWFDLALQKIFVAALQKVYRSKCLVCRNVPTAYIWEVHNDSKKNIARRLSLRNTWKKTWFLIRRKCRILIAIRRVACQDNWSLVRFTRTEICVFRRSPKLNHCHFQAII